MVAAATLASAGIKTLLLDCDFQFGDMRELLGAKRAYGVDEVLSGAVPLSDLPRDEQGLCLIAAPRRLEQSETIVHELPALLDSAMAHFDAIVANTGANWGEQHAVLLERSSRGAVSRRSEGIVSSGHASMRSSCALVAGLRQAPSCSSRIAVRSARCSHQSMCRARCRVRMLPNLKMAEWKSSRRSHRACLRFGFLAQCLRAKRERAYGRGGRGGLRAHWLRPKSPRRLRAGFSPSGALAGRGCSHDASRSCEGGGK